MKMIAIHDCDQRIYLGYDGRVAQMDDNRWFLQRNGERQQILACPFCGATLSELCAGESPFARAGRDIGTIVHPRYPRQNKG